MSKRPLLKRIVNRKNFIRAIAAGGLAAVGGAAYMRFVEPEWLEVTRRELDLSKTADKRRVRILHLSDFHLSDTVPLSYIRTSIELGLAQEPDVVCLTGDFITNSLPEKAAYTRAMGKLASKHPTFACLGNHDGGSWAARVQGPSSHKGVREVLKDAGVRLLFNEREELSMNGVRIVFAGLGDLWCGDMIPGGVLAGKAEGERAPVVVLAHNPDSKDLLDDFHWDLMLSGHTHGGQLRVPLIRSTPFAPVKDHRYVDGLREWRGRWINVSRGVGNLHGMRINCRPEVGVLDLYV